MRRTGPGHELHQGANVHLGPFCGLCLLDIYVEYLSLSLFIVLVMFQFFVCFTFSMARIYGRFCVGFFDDQKYGMPVSSC